VPVLAERERTAIGQAFAGLERDAFVERVPAAID